MKLQPLEHLINKKIASIKPHALSLLILVLALNSCTETEELNPVGSWKMSSWTCEGESENIFGPSISPIPCDGQDSLCYYYQIDFGEMNYTIIQADNQGMIITESGVYELDDSKIYFYDQNQQINQIWNRLDIDGEILSLFGPIDFRNCESEARFEQN